MTAEGVSAIVNLTFVPYGNARGEPPQVTCQHGPNECTANMYENCVINLYPDQDIWYPYVYCLEGSDESWSLSESEKCVKQCGLDWDKISACQTNSTISDEYVRAAARTTNNLDPPHKWTPWVTLYDEQSGTAVAPVEDTDGLLSMICKAYTGVKPAGCNDVAVETTHSSVCWRDGLEPSNSTQV